MVCVAEGKARTETVARPRTCLAVLDAREVEAARGISAERPTWEVGMASLTTTELRRSTEGARCCVLLFMLLVLPVVVGAEAVAVLEGRTTTTVGVGAATVGVAAGRVVGTGTAIVVVVKVGVATTARVVGVEGATAVVVGTGAGTSGTLGTFAVGQETSKVMAAPGAEVTVRVMPVARTMPLWYVLVSGTVLGPRTLTPPAR